jgi:hypothetical protein
MRWLLIRHGESVGNRWWPILSYQYGDHRIWGATARIIKGFLDHLAASGG